MSDISRAPLRWLEDSTAEEIGEALLSIGIKKATSVVVYLARRIGPDLGEAIDLAVERAKENPASTLMGMLDGFIGSRSRH